MPKNFTKRQAAITIGAVVLVIIGVVIFFMNLRPKPNNAAATILNVWGTEPESAFSAALSAYPYATVKYTQVDPVNYDSEVVSALAAGNGPDVFEVGNRSIPRWKSVLAPLYVPTSSASAFGPAQVAQIYPDIVSSDWISGGDLYGLPLSIDTLVMAYNKDLFNAAGIAVPPANWNDFDTDTALLRKVDGTGVMTQAAAAIGGDSSTVPNATDILSLLMLQAGTNMTTANDSSASFASAGNGNGAGLQAFNYYLQFVNPSSPNYAWNSSFGPGLDSFAAGKTAIVFIYQSDFSTLKAKAPFLSYAIAPMPQANGAQLPVNYAKYNGFVASKAGNQPAAWNFIIYETAQDNLKPYLVAAGMPPALRTDIAADQGDPNMSVFANQALTAKSWYEANDVKIDGIFNSAILNTLNGEEDAGRALSEAESSVTQLMQ